MYYGDKNDFRENPYKFLLEGNVLIIRDTQCLGCDWTNVILFEGDDTSETYHDCNYMMRCTTNLIVVRRGTTSDNSSDESDE